MLSQNETQTQKLAADLLKKYLPNVPRSPLIFALEGELGSGKTVFVKGLAKALGIKKIIRSPSYTLVSEYEYQLDNHQGKLIHVDLWRIKNEKEFLALGIERDLKPGNIIAIEWAEKIKNYLGQLEVKVVYLKFEHHRKNSRRILPYRRRTPSTS